jgi:large subunit ribosomal protein L9
MATKLLLIEDVESLGRKGDIVSVREGFARNFLVPKKFAMIADKNTLRQKARLQEEREKQASVDLKESESIAKNFENKMVTTFVKVDHDGHMYGSVSQGDILNLIQDQLNISLEKRSILLKHHLKTIGNHTVEIKLKEGVTTSVKVRIVPEGTVPEDETVEAPAVEA